MTPPKQEWNSVQLILLGEEQLARAELEDPQSILKNLSSHERYDITSMLSLPYTYSSDKQYSVITIASFQPWHLVFSKKR